MTDINLRPAYLAEQVHEAQALIERNVRELSNMGINCLASEVVTNDHHRPTTSLRYAEYRPDTRRYKWSIVRPAVMACVSEKEVL